MDAAKEAPVDQSPGQDPKPAMLQEPSDIIRMKLPCLPLGAGTSSGTMNSIDDPPLRPGGSSTGASTTNERSGGTIQGSLTERFGFSL